MVTVVTILTLYIQDQVSVVCEVIYVTLFNRFIYIFIYNTLYCRLYYYSSFWKLQIICIQCICICVGTCQPQPACGGFTTCRSCFSLCLVGHSLNSSQQVWWQAPLLTEASHLILICQLYLNKTQNNYFWSTWCMLHMCVYCMIHKFHHHKDYGTYFAAVTLATTLEVWRGHHWAVSTDAFLWKLSVCSCWVHAGCARLSTGMEYSRHPMAIPCRDLSVSGWHTGLTGVWTSLTPFLFPFRGDLIWTKSLPFFRMHIIPSCPSKRQDINRGYQHLSALVLNKLCLLSFLIHSQVCEPRRSEPL